MFAGKAGEYIELGCQNKKKRPNLNFKGQEPGGVFCQQQKCINGAAGGPARTPGGPAERSLQLRGDGPNARARRLVLANWARSRVRRLGRSGRWPWRCGAGEGRRATGGRKKEGKLAAENCRNIFRHGTWEIEARRRLPAIRARFVSIRDQPAESVGAAGYPPRAVPSALIWTPFYLRGVDLPCACNKGGGGGRVSSRKKKS